MVVVVVVVVVVAALETPPWSLLLCACFQEKKWKLTVCSIVAIKNGVFKQYE